MLTSACRFVLSAIPLQLVMVMVMARLEIQLPLKNVNCISIAARGLPLCLSVLLVFFSFFLFELSCMVTVNARL